MMRTVEAEINVDGTVTLLEPLRVRVKTKALVTVLSEQAEEAEASKKENLRAVFSKMRGVEMFRGIENVREWQRKLRDEWE
jgi:hypothetical protein